MNSKLILIYPQTPKMDCSQLIMKGYHLNNNKCYQLTMDAFCKIILFFFELDLHISNKAKYLQNFLRQIGKANRFQILLSETNKNPLRGKIVMICIHNHYVQY